MLFKFVARVLVVVAFLSIHAPAFAALSPNLGYEAQLLYQSGLFSFAGGLDVGGNYATFAIDTNVYRLNLTNASAQHIGTLPSPNVGASYIKWAGDDLHVAYAPNFAFPPPCRFGVVSDGVFQDFGMLGGIYDAAVNSEGTLYVMAAPSLMTGSKVYRFEAATTSLVEVILIGGYSGGIAFDPQDRLYVAEQMDGKILRYTAEQLLAGNLTMADGEVVIHAFASYVCIDPHNQLYAVTGYGNELSVYDITTGQRRREIAVDDASGYGIGWIGWDQHNAALILIYTDYYIDSASSVYSIRFSSATNGIPGTSTIFRSWIANYQDLVHPHSGSGGFAMDDDHAVTTPGGAIIGKPAEFDPDVGNAHVLSLGNGGTITLQLDDAIANGPGADFAVFENAFNAWGGTHAEFAFVDVATTTNVWARFPVTYYGTNVIAHNSVQDVRRVDGLAGKHTTTYGTPFDLDLLQGHSNVLGGAIDLNRIAYIRLTDVVGDGSTLDQLGNPIYDPYQVNATPTDGFDLRAIGVIHLAGLHIATGAPSPAMQGFGYTGRTYQPQRFNGQTWVDVGSALAGTGGVFHVQAPADQAVFLMRVEQTFTPTP